MLNPGQGRVPCAEIVSRGRRPAHPPDNLNRFLKGAPGAVLGRYSNPSQFDAGGAVELVSGSADPREGSDSTLHTKDGRMQDKQLRTLLDLGSLVLLAMLAGSFIHVIRTALHAAP